VSTGEDILLLLCLCRGKREEGSRSMKMVYMDLYPYHVDDTAASECGLLCEDYKGVTDITGNGHEL
jgi:hypothetical protein